MLSSILRLPARALLRPRPCFSTAAPANLDDLMVRVRSYNNERFPLSALTAIRAQNGGWALTPYDADITNDIRAGLAADAASHGLKVSSSPDKKLRLEAKPGYTSWKRDKLRVITIPDKRSLYDPELFHIEGEFPDGYTSDFVPRAKALTQRLSKAWVPVDTSKAKTPRRDADKGALRRWQAEMLVKAEPGLSDQMLNRLSRTAASSKKSMRHVIKDITSRATRALGQPLAPLW